MKRWLTVGIGFGVSAAALYFAFRNADLAKMLEALRTARYEYVALTALVITLSTMLRGWRWQVLMGRRAGFADSFWLWNIGYFFNDVLPLRIGEIARVMLIARRPGISFTGALSSVVVERLMDMVMVAALVAVSLLLAPLPDWATRAGLFMGIGSVVGLGGLAFAARWPEGALRLGSRLLGLIPGVGVEKAAAFLAPFVEGLGGVSDLRIFAGGLLLSVMAWMASILGAWVLMFAFWPQVPLGDVVLIIAAAGLGNAVPSAPAAVGTFEAAIILVLALIHYDPSRSQSYALVLHASVIAVTVALGVLGLLREGVSFGEVAREAQSLSDQPPA